MTPQIKGPIGTPLRIPTPGNDADRRHPHNLSKQRPRPGDNVRARLREHEDHHRRAHEVVRGREPAVAVLQQSPEPDPPVRLDRLRPEQKAGDEEEAHHADLAHHAVEDDGDSPHLFVRAKK
jgi:hypothetical protein